MSVIPDLHWGHSITLNSSNSVSFTQLANSFSLPDCNLGLGTVLYPTSQCLPFCRPSLPICKSSLCTPLPFLLVPYSDQEKHASFSVFFQLPPRDIPFLPISGIGIFLDRYSSLVGHSLLNPLPPPLMSFMLSCIHLSSQFSINIHMIPATGLPFTSIPQPLSDLSLY